MTYFVDFDRTIFDTDRFKREYGMLYGLVLRAFKPRELERFLYPDAKEFLHTHGHDVVIVTYGIRAYAHVKVTSALAGFHLKGIYYTALHKGVLLQKLTAHASAPCMFIDDAVFQLLSVSELCPKVSCIEMRRDGSTGYGRWPVVHSFDHVK